MDVGNLNADREPLGKARLENEWKRHNMVAQVNHGIPEGCVPCRIAGESLNSELQAPQIRELLHANGIESEVDAEWLECAIGATGSVLAVALVEPGPLTESAKTKHPSRKHQGIVTNTEHALSARGVGENRDDCQCYGGNADQRTAHRLSADVKEQVGRSSEWGTSAGGETLSLRSMFCQLGFDER